MAVLTMKTMATKQSPEQIKARHEQNLRDRNAMRMEACKRWLGTAYIGDPENKRVGWGWRV